MSAPADAQLMVDYRNGGLAAFHSLFVRHARRLTEFFWCLCGDLNQAEALSAQTWLQVRRHRKSYSDEKSFIAWLYTFAVQIRREAARTAAVSASQPGEPRAITDGASLVRALHDLPDSYREVLVLHRLVGLSFSETARVLGATESAVEQRAQQGDEQLGGSSLQVALIDQALAPVTLEHIARAVLPTVARELSAPSGSFRVLSGLVFAFLFALTLLRLFHRALGR